MADGWYDLSPEGGWPWESLPPGPELARVVAAVDPDSLAGEAAVSLVAACERLAGWATVQTGRAMVAVADAVRAETADRAGIGASDRQSWVGEELAPVLRVAPATANGRAMAAGELVRRRPVLGRAVAAGELTWMQAVTLAQGVRALDGVLDERGRDLSDVAVTLLLPDAGRYPPARLRERVAARVMQLDPEGAAQRRRSETRRCTGVEMWPEPDGLACLAVRGPAPDVLRLRGRIHAEAQRIRERSDHPLPAGGPGADGERPTVGQWRFAAVLAAFGLRPLNDETPSSTEPVPVSHPRCDRPEVRVVVDLATLFGLSDAPAELEGFGPIDADLARALAADADWVRWVTDPVNGYLLDAGGRRLPTPAQARFVRARDGRCSHPTCGRRAAHCDIDHVPEFRSAGRTAVDGLAPGCAKHNRSRDAAGWRAQPHEASDPYGGPAPVWTSPLGRRYYAVTDPLLPASPAPRDPPPDHPPDDPPPDDPPPDDPPPF